MPNRRAEIELAPAEQAAMLDTARTAILVTIGPDGVPDPTAMWFVVVDGQTARSYDMILGNPVVRGGQIAEGEFSRSLRFDSPEDLRYIAVKDKRSIFVVEEKLK